MLTTRYCAAALAAAVSLGASASQAQQAPPQSPNMTFFVTSIGPGKGADLGGLKAPIVTVRRSRKMPAPATRPGALISAATRRGRAARSMRAIGSDPARGRISKARWSHRNVDDLHSDNNKLSMENSLTERGTIVSGTGMTPNQHDVLTGSSPEGRAFPANMNLTCGNWTSSTFGSAMVGHIDRNGTVITPFVKSWNAAHMSRSCSQPGPDRDRRQRPVLLLRPITNDAPLSPRFATLAVAGRVMTRFY